MLPSGNEAVHSSAESDSSFSTDAEYQEPLFERPRSVFGGILVGLGMTSRRRREAKPELDYFTASRDELVEGLLRKKLPLGEQRKSRHIYTSGIVKKALIFVPVVALSVL